MLEKILNEQFRGMLKLVFTDIAIQQDRRDEEEFAKDEVRIKEDLIDTVDPYPANVTLPEDFCIAAVDGSGTWVISTVDNSASVGFFLSMLDVSGTAAVAYRDFTNTSLKYTQGNFVNITYNLEYIATT